MIAFLACVQCSGQTLSYSNRLNDGSAVLVFQVVHTNALTSPEPQTTPTNTIGSRRITSWKTARYEMFHVEKVKTNVVWKGKAACPPMWLDSGWEIAFLDVKKLQARDMLCVLYMRDGHVYCEGVPIAPQYVTNVTSLSDVVCDCRLVAVASGEVKEGENGEPRVLLVTTKYGEVIFEKREGKWLGSKSLPTIGVRKQVPLHVK